MAVLGLPNTPGELSASGNGGWQTGVQTANATGHTQPLENGAPPAEQAERAAEEPAELGMPKGRGSRCPAADGQGRHQQAAPGGTSCSQPCC